MITSESSRSQVPFRFCFLVPLALILIGLCADSVRAVETQKDLGSPKLRNIARIIRPDDVARVNLKEIRKIAVLISSTAPMYGQMANDLLSVNLRDLGFSLEGETTISDITLRELGRMEGQSDTAGTGEPKQTLDIVKVGRIAGLDAVFTGTLIEGRRQSNFTEAKPQQVVEKTVVSTLYLQVVDIRSEKVVLAVMLEYDEGENLPNSVETMIKIISDEFGRGRN